MSEILLKNVVLNGAKTDVAISGKRFSQIGDGLPATPCTEVIDCSGMAILPPFYNAHTHASMTLLRGFADDLELFPWLSEHIWPAEALLTDEDIYWGGKLAMLEMIRSGTVFFNDMYYGQFEVIRAACEMGMRAAVGMLHLSTIDPVIVARNKQVNARLLAARNEFSDLITIAYAPHAVYTVDEESLREIAEGARANDMSIHIHVSETKKEVDDCIAAHGRTPIAYLKDLGILTPKTLLAHAVHLTDDDIDLVENADSVLVTMPVSNMKLVSGQFRFRDCCGKHNCRLALGTDGASSNNSLSMLNEMKFAALSGKLESGDPTTASAPRIFDAATRGGATAFGIDAGIIEVGRLADCMLVDLNTPELAAGHHLLSDMVYAANPACIDTVVCNGRVLMKHRVVPGSREIVEHYRECCHRIAARCSGKF